MTTQLHDKAIPAPPAPETDHLAAPRNDVDYLTAYEAAARAIFVEANGLNAYYRTYYNDVHAAGWVTGTREGDRGQVFWRDA